MNAKNIKAIRTLQRAGMKPQHIATLIDTGATYLRLFAKVHRCHKRFFSGHTNIRTDLFRANLPASLRDIPV